MHSSYIFKESFNVFGIYWLKFLWNKIAKPHICRVESISNFVQYVNYQSPKNYIADADGTSLGEYFSCIVEGYPILDIFDIFEIG